jgi:hypothetical protein
LVAVRNGLRFAVKFGGPTEGIDHLNEQDNPTDVSTARAMAGLFKAVATVSANIAPERMGELATEIFGSESWTLACADGAANFYAIVPDKRINWSNAGLAALWNIAFVAFSIADIGTRERLKAQTNRKVGSISPTGFDVSQLWNKRNLGGRIAYAEKLFSIDTPWPPDIPQPTNAASSTELERKVRELFLGALGWLVLHEIGHVALNHEVVVPAAQRVTQEHQADEFATKWILDGAGHGLQREFRVMAVSTAMAYLLLNHRVKGVGATHPPAIQRIRRIIEEFDVCNRSVGLESAAYFLKAIFDPDTIQPPPDGPREAFDWVIERLRQLFP